MSMTPQILHSFSTALLLLAVVIPTARSDSRSSGEIKVLPQDGNGGAHFGGSLSLSGGLALVGASGDRINGVKSGSAYVFDAVTGQELNKLVPLDGAVDDLFGSSVALSGNLALIGAHQDDENGSQPRSGCHNGVFASGARLTGDGIASVSNDSLVLTTRWAEPTNAGLYFQANQRVNAGDGITFGDGLRCAGFGLIRLEVLFTDADGESSTSVAIGATGGVSAGETKRYQFWYRTMTAPPCGLGVNDFNLSNGFEVIWQP